MWWVRVVLTACLYLIVVGNVHAEHVEEGIASVYGGADGLCGSGRADGGRVDCKALHAAHKPPMKLGTRVRVTNKQNGKSIEVTVNDRGPYVKGRIIDLTPAAASALGFCCLAPVTVEPVVP